MQKSEIFNMNLFESGDPVKAEFFNENTQILETALQHLPHMVSGTFSQPAEGSGKTLTFSKPPQFVVIVNNAGMLLMPRNCTYAYCVFSGITCTSSVTCTWSGNKLILGCTGVHVILHNLSGDGAYFAFLGSAEDGGAK